MTSQNTPEQRNTDTTSASSIAMLGEGFYSRVSLGPKAVIDNATTLVLDALNRLDISPHKSATITLADYGAADGGTSLDLVNASVDWVRQRHPKLPVSLCYTDLPGADFETLFRTMSGEVKGKQSPLTRHSDVHVFSSGMSFYRQLLPTATLDLGFSASAMHYLSSMPGPIKNHVHATGASEAEKAKFRRVAVRDWETILLMRSRELKPGGRVVLVNFCIDAEGRYLGNTGGANLFDTYNELWVGMRNDGVITAGEYEATAFQQFYKSVGETLAPLQQEASPVYQSGLVLEQHETALVRCPFQRAFQQGMDARTFAHQFVNTHRSWTETTFRAGLKHRSKADADGILNELYRRYAQTVEAEPEQHAKDLVHLYMVAVKRSPVTTIG